ncbi:enoyl-CoA hydratase/isomerase family protein [Solitalea lacus]|uniref:enoyl-CoA hydratase/isomerase family protein n=1 Tax=Solitalea lacus TaxID=2911172 RepID=UPI001EDC304E|nr:enoyl-CoA hydratase-related protein [Solitalea lacus]UKJ08122.1 enoyl-CoA hydratase-related protein [Solitalea lacus]
MYNNIKTEINNRILYITINRATKLNALNKETLAELNALIKDFYNNPEAGVAIITGDGPKAFVAGADISEFASFSIEEGKQLAATGHSSVFDLIENSPKPIIAAVNGFALGGGLELAMACHFRVASINAKLGLPEVTLGLIPGYGGTQRLSQLVGKAKALELILTADMIGAEDALALGLVNYITSPDELIAKCEELAGKMLTKAPLALSAAIAAVNASTKNEKNGFEVEIDEFGKLFGTEDFKEGTQAFLEKRKANFTGR